MSWNDCPKETTRIRHTNDRTFRKHHLWSWHWHDATSHWQSTCSQTLSLEIATLQWKRNLLTMLLFVYWLQNLQLPLLRLQPLCEIKSQEKHDNHSLVSFVYLHWKGLNPLHEKTHCTVFHWEGQFLTLAKQNQPNQTLQAPQQQQFKIAFQCSKHSKIFQLKSLHLHCEFRQSMR